MQLIGVMDSPFVRRVVLTLKVLDLPFEHAKLSVFRNFEEIAAINPVVKVPTLVTDEGTVLLDSNLILQYVEGLIGRSLLPAGLAERAAALHLIGLALAACEKSVQFVYEKKMRPQDKWFEGWLERLNKQLSGAYRQLETDLAPKADTLDVLSQAGIAVAVAWRFTQHFFPGHIDATAHPVLAAYSAKAEAHPIYLSTPLD